MCKYCEKDWIINEGLLIADNFYVTSTLTITDRFSKDARMVLQIIGTDANGDCSKMEENPIKYCPMCGDKIGK